MKKIILTAAAIVTGLVCPAQQPETEMKYTTQNNTEFARTIADPTVQLVDVRTPGEYAEGHIPGAVNMDIQSAGFEQQTAALDKSRPIAVYCRSGVRSKAAAARLAAQGYEVRNLDGGITRWDGVTTR